MFRFTVDKHYDFDRLARFIIGFIGVVKCRKDINLVPVNRTYQAKKVFEFE